jgi:agmatine deiminase
MTDGTPDESQLPAKLGYRWPAEWEPHAATWLSWPRNPATWPGYFEHVPGEFAHLVRTIARFEPLNILAGGEQVMRQARELVGDLPNVRLHDIETNDAWCRDHGPTFLQRSGFGVQGSGGRSNAQRGVGGAETRDTQCVLRPQHLPPALIDWEYNAWGGKYPPFDKDNEVPRKIAALTGRRVFSPGIILEGGAIEGNGEGVLLTTESCLLNPNRNPHLSREQTEKHLRDYLGVSDIWWLTGGEIAGDDTDGHIDQLARFVAPRTIVVAVCDKESDENYAPTQQNMTELTGLGKELSCEIVPLPLPGPKYVEGQRLPASYCNFIFVNGGLIVPTFDDPADQIAIDTLQRLLPGRRVVGAPSLNLIWGLGSFHCLSQQEPLP